MNSVKFETYIRLKKQKGAEFYLKNTIREFTTVLLDLQNLEDILNLHSGNRSKVKHKEIELLSISEVETEHTSQDNRFVVRTYKRIELLRLDVGDILNDLDLNIPSFRKGRELNLLGRKVENIIAYCVRILKSLQNAEDFTFTQLLTLEDFQRIEGIVIRTKNRFEIYFNKNPLDLPQKTGHEVKLMSINKFNGETDEIKKKIRFTIQERSS